MSVIILACLIFMLAGFVQGITGFGAGVVAIPLLCFIMDIKMAVPLCLLNGLVITGYLAFILRKTMDRRKILPLLLGSLPGILLGAGLLKTVNPNGIRLLLGVLLVSFSCYTLVTQPKPLILRSAWGYVAGFWTGIITALLSAGGPPAIIYATLTPWNKEEIRATLTGFFVTSGAVTVLVHLFTGSTTVDTLRLLVFTVPAVLLGTALGSGLSGRIDRAVYMRLVYFFLGIMGCMMIAT